MFKDWCTIEMIVYTFLERRVNAKLNLFGIDIWILNVIAGLLCNKRFKELNNACVLYACVLNFRILYLFLTLIYVLTSVWSMSHYWKPGEEPFPISWR